MIRNARRRGRFPRRGVATLLVVVSLTMLLGALAVVLNQARLWQARVELQNAADAAALAAAGALVDDDLLRGDPSLLPALLAEARAEAIQYGQNNPVLGQALTLDPNLANAADGDIVFGSLDSSTSTNLVLADHLADPANSFLPLINAVRITARRTRARGNPVSLILSQVLTIDSTDVAATATALLDRDVIGFRPSGQQPLPLAPVALLSDPSGTNPLSWEHQVGSGGQDQYRFDRSSQQFVLDTNGDGLPEMRACLALPDAPNGPNNTCLLQIGVADLATLTRQLDQGITAADLVPFGGQLVLPANTGLNMDGSLVGPARGGPDLAALQQSLQELAQRAEPRIWPLFTVFDPAHGSAILTGFVAARVVLVQPLAANAPLCFLLQPTLVSSAAAVTDATRRSGTVPALPNPYVCKVRLTR